MVSYVPNAYRPTYPGGIYILSSFEFRFDTAITGFSYYATNGGTITIYVINKQYLFKIFFFNFEFQF